MNRFLINFLLLLLFIPPVFSQNTTPGYRIKYISAENVYLDGGRYDSLAVGDTLQIIKNGKRISLLRIIYTSESSSACQSILSSAQIQRGDFAIPVSVWRQPLRAAEDPKPKSSQRVRKRNRQIPSVQAVKAGKRRRTVISGTLAAQWFHFKDHTAYGLRLDQPTARLNLRLKDLFYEGVEIRIRARSRYRERDYASSLKTVTEWDHRVYTVSAAYHPKGSPWLVRMGRIISNPLAGIGALDGLQAQRSLSERVHLGVVGGTQPQWQYGAVQPEFKKVGLYAGYTFGSHYSERFESTIAFAGEYLGSTISREFFYVQNLLNLHGWSLFQSSELELNRAWRLEKTGQKLSLTSLFSTVDYAWNRWLSTGIQYDNRRPVWTYTYRTVGDSLFNEAFRRGLRGRLSVKADWKMRLILDTGIRTVSDDPEKAVSWSMRILQSVSSRTTIQLSVRGFSNHYTDGSSRNLNASLYFGRGHSMTAEYRISQYRLRSIRKYRSGETARFDLSLQLPARFYLSEQYEYQWGNDRTGHQLFVELGRRF